MFPPYVQFSHKNTRFYRRYTSDSLFHECFTYTKEKVLYEEDYKRIIEEIAKNKDAFKNNIGLDNSGIGDISNNTDNNKDQDYQYKDNNPNTNPQSNYNSHSNYHKPDISFPCQTNKECEFFRGIDKIRFIFFGASSHLHLEKLESNNFLQIFYSGHIARDEVAFKDSINNITGNYMSLIETRKVKQNNQFLRNYYGEQIAYYFLYTTHYIKWLIIPCILAIVFKLTALWVHHYEIKSKNYSSKNINYIMEAILTMLLIIWGSLYTRSWICNENFYNHIWGMNQYNTKHEELSTGTVRKAFIYLGVKISIRDNFKKTALRIIGYFIMLLMTMLTISVNIFLFYITLDPKNFYADKLSLSKSTNSTNSKSNNEIWIKNLLRQFSPVLAVLLRTFLSILNYKVVQWVVDFEMYLQASNYYNAYTMKIVLFEFWNYYFYLFYIAYYKKYIEKCEYNDCFDDLGKNLFIILLTSNILNFIEILKPWIFLKKNNIVLEAALKSDSKNNLDSKDKIYLRSDYSDSLSFEYINIVLNYGYVMLFGIVYPLCFILSIIHVFVQRIVNSNKMLKLHNIHYMHGAKGIGICHKVIKILTFIGIITNTTIIFFTSQDSMNIKGVAGYKWPLVFAIENILAFIFLFAEFDSLPSWFEYADNMRFNYIVRILNKENVRTDVLDAVDNKLENKKKKLNLFKKRK